MSYFYVYEETDGHNVGIDNLVSLNIIKIEKGSQKSFQTKIQPITKRKLKENLEQNLEQTNDENENQNKNKNKNVFPDNWKKISIKLGIDIDKSFKKGAIKRMKSYETPLKFLQLLENWIKENNTEGSPILINSNVKDSFLEYYYFLYGINYQYETLSIEEYLNLLEDKLSSEKSSQLSFKQQLTLV